MAKPWTGRRLARLVLLAAWIALLACSGPATRGGDAAATTPPAAGSGEATLPVARESVRVVTGTISASVTPIVVTIEAGFAARHGLDLQLVVARSGSEAMAALLAGDVQIGSLSGNALVNASAAGAELVMIALQQTRQTYQIMAGPDLRTPADLKGKRLGVADVGGNSDLAAQYLFDRFGLRRGEDVAVAALGSQNERLGGLQAGAVQAAMLQAPFTAAARNAGYHSIFDYAEEDYELPTSAVVVTRAYLRDHPETLRKFVTALVDAIHYFKTERAGTIAILGRFLQQDDVEVLGEIYRESAGGALPETPYPSLLAMTNALNEIAPHNEAAARLRPEDLIDDRIVRELDESGYVRALYGR